MIESLVENLASEENRELLNIIISNIASNPDLQNMLSEGIVVKKETE